jgi:hypothetical protein
MKVFTNIPGRNASEPPHIGRPSLYNDANVSRILGGLRGGLPLTRICRKAGAPSRRVISNWRLRYPAFDAAFRAARWAGYCHLFRALVDEIEDLLDAGYPAESVASLFRLKARRFKHDRYAHAAPDSPAWPTMTPPAWAEEAR